MAEIDTAFLKAMLPSALDDIVRANRDKVELALASEEQLAPLSKSVAATNQVRGAISDWRFIAMTVDIPERRLWMENVYLVGVHEGHDWITSAIQSIDRERMLVRTRNSVYRLIGDPGIGEPDTGALLGICSAFTAWGWGPMLGVPTLFY